MTYIRIIAAADGTPTIYAGQFVREYRPASMDERGAYRADGVLTVTSEVSRALAFPDCMAAFDFYLQANGRRPDGKPNRPLTSYTVDIGPAP